MHVEIQMPNGAQWRDGVVEASGMMQKLAESRNSVLRRAWLENIFRIEYLRGLGSEWGLRNKACLPTLH